MQEIGRDESRAPVEERDYIGLSEASSAIEMDKKKSSGPILREADLRLGLGLGLALGCCSGEDDDDDADADADAKPAKETFLDRPCSTERIGTKRGASEITRKPLWLQGSSSIISGICSQDSTASEAPPCKDQIVGWPPVRLYRKQTLSKPAEMFVKVNMDGVTVGRKVDLSAYGCYKGLLLALEEMFQPAVRDSDNKHFLLSNEPDYVLTYEDKEGDWMLVGDVPWSMFTSTVGRLRIARGSEANGTGVGMPHPTSAKFCR